MDREDFIIRERTLFVRQAANLWQVKAAIQQRLTMISGQADDPIQVIDTLPLPVCGYTRSRRDRCFKSEADYGYCAAKDFYLMCITFLNNNPTASANKKVT